MLAEFFIIAILGMIASSPLTKNAFGDPIVVKALHQYAMSHPSHHQKRSLLFSENYMFNVVNTQRKSVNFHVQSLDHVELVSYTLERTDGEEPIRIHLKVM
jgi:hypothetical protein